MKIMTTLRDGYRNLTASLGTARDKASHGTYGYNFQSDIDLAIAYRASSVAKAIVDLPAEDSCREWRAWMGDSAQISKIEEVEKNLQVQAKVMEARTRARLLGGAAIFIGNGDKDLTKPLDPSRIKKGGLKYLTVLSKHELGPLDLERDPREPNYGKPTMYQMSTGLDGTFQIHPSRLAVFIGEKNVDGYVLDSWDGWGTSVLPACMDKVKQLDGTAANIAALVFEAKIDVINIKGLTQSLRDGGEEYEESLKSRFGLASLMKSNNGTLILDGDEVYSQKNFTFATLPDILDRGMQLVSQASRIPMTRFFGTSPGGMNATGESDTRFYYDGIRQEQTLEMQPAMAAMDECIVRSALGNYPATMHYNWRPLWQMSEADRAKVSGDLATTADKMLKMGVPQEVVVTAIVNAVTEIGAFPGLDEAMEEFKAFTENEQEIQGLGLPSPEEMFSGEIPPPPEGQGGGQALLTKDYNASQPRFPKGSPLGGKWLGEGGGTAMAAYDDVLSGLATTSYPVPKLRALVEKGNKSPKSLTQYEGKKLNAIKKGLQAKGADFALVKKTAAKKAALDKAHQSALKAVATDKYPAQKIHGLLTKDPKALTQYEGKKLNAYKKALQAEQAKLQAVGATAPAATPVAPAPAATKAKPKQPAATSDVPNTNSFLEVKNVGLEQANGMAKIAQQNADSTFYKAAVENYKSQGFPQATAHIKAQQQFGFLPSKTKVGGKVINKPATNGPEAAKMNKLAGLNTGEKSAPVLAPSSASASKPTAPAVAGSAAEKAAASIATKQYPTEKIHELVAKAQTNPKSLTQYEGKKLNAYKKALAAEGTTLKAAPTKPSTPVGSTSSFSKADILAGKSGYHNAGESYLKKDYGLAPSSQPQANFATEVKNLAPDEYSSLKSYTGGGYQQINKGLRSGGAPTSKVKAIDAALAKHTAVKDFVVVRGFSRDAMQKIVPTKGLQVGAVISDKAYLSTTRQVGTAKGFSGGSSGSYVGVIRVKQGQKIAAVKHLSNHPTEDEFIIPRNAKLRVVNIKPEYGIIELEYID